MTVLVTGASGFLGPYLMTEFGPKVAGVSRLPESIGPFVVSPNLQCDLTEPKSVAYLMDVVRPTVVVHAAAMTDVNKCQEQPDEAIKQNVTATKNIVEAMPKGCKIVYISTDQIYSGPGPHKENSKSENPLNMYGLSKYMGEFEAAKAEKHLIVRTNIFGFSKKATWASSLVDFYINALQSGAEVNLFTDVLFSPLYAGTLAKHVHQMSRSNRSGTFNLGSTGGMSKSKFAILLAKNLGIPLFGARPGLSTTSPSRVVRPIDTRLDISRVETSFDLVMPNLEQDLEAMCLLRRQTN